MNVQAQSKFTTETASSSTTQFIHENYSLSNAYPNPANAETKLDYNFKVITSNAKIIIRSLLGYVVSEHNIEDNAGTISIPTSDLPGGIYFYSLSVGGDIIITRKLVVRH